jgi:SAM-dependent methyltransferase
MPPSLDGTGCAAATPGTYLVPVHPSSFEKMRAFRDTYLATDDRDTLRVLDVGSMGDRASSYRALFEPPAFEYVGLDLADGPNVDLVPADPYRWDTLLPESFDLVISGQAFEHNPYFWITAAEIARVLVEGGLTTIIAPSRGPVHRHPFDCWRFYPDSWSVLCQYVGLELLESSVDNGSWRKMVPGTMAWRESFMVARKPSFVDETARDAFYQHIEGIARTRRALPEPQDLDALEGPAITRYEHVHALPVATAIRLQPERLLARALFRIGAGNSRLSRHLYANSERFATRRGEQSSPWPTKGASD